MNSKYKTGDVINNFTLIKPGNKKGEWVVKHKCGHEYQARIHLIKNQSTCKNCWTAVKGNKHPQWQGAGEIHKELIGIHKNSALTKGVEFNITVEYAWSIFLSQDRKCAFTGEELHFTPSFYNKKHRTASLDRIDSTKGYVPGNIQWVHKDVNKLKKNFSDDRFIEICKKVAEHAKDRNGN